jgi:hypothetical protein
MTDVSWPLLRLMHREFDLPHLSPYELAQRRLATRDVGDPHLTVVWHLMAAAQWRHEDGWLCEGEMPAVSAIAAEHDLTLREVQVSLVALGDIDVLTLCGPEVRSPNGSYLLDIGELPARCQALVPPPPPPPIQKQPPLPSLPWYLRLVVAVLSLRSMEGPQR